MSRLWRLGRYRTTDETAIVGESLAGLFVVETFLAELAVRPLHRPQPQLWWNSEAPVKRAGERLRTRSAPGASLYLATSDEPGIPAPTARLAEALGANPSAGLRWLYEPMPEETHSTIYHPAALRAFRALFKPAPAP